MSSLIRVSPLPANPLSQFNYDLKDQPPQALIRSLNKIFLTNIRQFSKETLLVVIPNLRCFRDSGLYDRIFQILLPWNTDKLLFGYLVQSLFMIFILSKESLISLIFSLTQVNSAFEYSFDEIKIFENTWRGFIPFINRQTVSNGFLRNFFLQNFNFQSFYLKFLNCQADDKDEENIFSNFAGFQQKYIKPAENDCYFAISASWIKLWKRYMIARTQLNSIFFQSRSGAHPGAIHNHSLQGQLQGTLKTQMKEGVDFFLFKKYQWQTLKNLYSFDTEISNQYFKGIRLSQKVVQITVHTKKQTISLSRKINHTVIWEAIIKSLDLPQGFKFYYFSVERDQDLVQITDLQHSPFKDSQISLIFLIVSFLDKEKLKMHLNNAVPGNTLDITHRPFNATDSKPFIFSISEKSIKVHYEGTSFVNDVTFGINEFRRSLEKKQNASFRLNPISQFDYQRGIVNTGNTCYINSVLQCLMNFQPFQNYFLRSSYMKHSSNVLKNLTSLAKHIVDPTYSQFSPLLFKESLFSLMNMFRGVLQHDAQQFLTVLLDKLSNEIDDLKTIRFNFIKESFQSKTRTCLICQKCGKQKPAEDNQFCLSLSLPEHEFHYFKIYYCDSQLRGKVMAIRLSKKKKLTYSYYLQQIREQLLIDVQNCILFQLSSDRIARLIKPSNPYQTLFKLGITDSSYICLCKYTVNYLKSQYENRKIAEGIWVDIKMHGGGGLAQAKILYKKNSSQVQVNRFFPLPVEKITVSSSQILSLGQLTIKSPDFQMDLLCENVIYDNSVMTSIAHPFAIRVPLAYRPQTAVTMLKKLISKELLQEQYKAQLKLWQYKFVRLANKQKCVICDGFLIEKADCKGKLCTGCQDGQPFAFYRQKDELVCLIVWKEKNSINQKKHYFIEESYTKYKLNNPDRTDLNSCFKNFLGKEKVDYNCQCSGDKSEYVQQIVLTPNLLIVHLKRFDYVDGNLVKINRIVDIPDSIEINKEKFELSSIINHYGSLDSGHYVAYLKRPWGWLLANDDVLQIREASSMDMDNVYMCFYKKQVVKRALRLFSI